MAANFCTICEEPTVEGSRLCAQHKSQAELFSKTFGPDKKTAMAEAERARLQKHPDYAAFRATFEQAVAKMLLRAEGTERRAPQIFVYTLDSAPKARTYYQASVATAGPGGFDVNGEAIRLALSHEGLVFQSLLQAFVARVDGLRAQTLYAVALELWPAEGRLALVEWPRENVRRELASFAVEGDDVAAQTLGSIVPEERAS